MAKSCRIHYTPIKTHSISIFPPFWLIQTTMFPYFFQGPQAIHWLHRARVVVVYHGRLTAGSREKMAGSRGSELDGISKELSIDVFDNRRVAMVIKHPIS